MLVRFIIILVSYIMLTFSTSFAENVEDTKADVAALNDFHEIIYVVWHDAWPNKNIKQLIDFVPSIEKGVANVEKSKLPGILREKQDKWTAGVKELTEISKKYKIAAAASDTVELLDAAEKLHGKFENLIRILKPSMKELQVFHESLYNLYHYYMPENNYKKIKETVSELKVKMNALIKAEIPKRISDKSDKFNAARNKLKISVENLFKVAKSGNNKEKIDKAIEEMHTNYQVLDGLFN